MKLEIRYVQQIGKYTYYRRGEFRQKIGGHPGTTEWQSNYDRIHESFKRGVADGFHYGTVGWLIVDYFRSPEFTELKPSTQGEYRRNLEKLKEAYGKALWKNITAAFVESLRNENAATWRKANYFVQLFSILGKRAILKGIRRDNPASVVKLLKRKKGWRKWHDSERDIFENGVKRINIRLAYFLAVYTGQRQSDILPFKRTRIENGLIEVNQDKTDVTVWIPIHPVLQEELDKIPEEERGEYIIQTASGGHYTKHGFQNMWKRELKALGLAGTKEESECTFHGLRKNAAVSLAEVGCSVDEIMSITGHTDPDSVRIYVEDAKRKTLAQNAMKKWKRAMKKNKKKAKKAKLAAE